MEPNVPPFVFLNYMTTRQAIPIVLGLAAVVFIFGRPRASGPQAGWYTDFSQASAESQKTGHLMMVDFNASWCGPCQQYKQEVFPSDDFKKATKDVILVDIDLDKNPGTAEKYKIATIPDIRFFSPNGKQVGSLVGYDGPSLFAEIAKAKGTLR